MTEKLKVILEDIVQDFKQLTPEEMQAELEEAKNSDWGKLLRGLHEFELFLEEPNDPSASSRTQDST